MKKRYKSTLNKDFINKLINEENQHIRHLNNIILDSISEKESIVTKVLEESKNEKLSFGMKIADKVASFGGSWGFIISFALIVAFWMLFNTMVKSHIFDPFPYILLNLLLSCLAAFQAPIILMSQNRQAEKEKRRSEDEYLINLKAELQTRELNSKIDVLITEQMKILIETQKIQLSNLNDLEKKIDKLSKNAIVR